jgi:hypothetical protein
VANCNNISDPPGYAAGIFYFKKVFLTLSLFIALAARSQPKMEVTETRKNFGFVQRGTVVNNEYEITNKGSEPLIITSAEVSCSCTTVEYPETPIAPGQHAKVTVVFNTRSAYGRQDRTVLLHSNDPHSPVKLRYKGTVSKE